MKLYRQDGSEVELSETDAQKWLAMKLATTEPPKQKVKAEVKTNQPEKEV